jgi:DNA polymerase (family X)
MPKDNDYSNSEVVQQLKEVLAAMQIKGADRFRIRAYDNAITSLDNLTINIHDLWEDGRVNSVPGIGSGIAQHLNELFTNGQVWEWENLKEELPDGMFALIGLRKIGAKKAFKLAKTFNLTKREDAVEQLKEHAEKKEIQVLPGFGEKSEKDILESIEQSKMTKNEKPRMLLMYAEHIALRVMKHMKQLDCIEKIDVLGSFRRRNPTIGDLDFVVATNEGETVIDHFLQFPEIAETLAKGKNKVMVVLRNDAQVDLRISTPEAYGAMLQYNTGNVQHNILLRTHALEKGLSLSEYGIKSKKTGSIKEFADEKEFYEHLGLQWVPPELRYGLNEIEVARAHKLPNLIKLTDIKGDLHSHSTRSDGFVPMEDMVTAAAELGYEYFGVSDHAPSIASRGYDEVKRLIKETREEIDGINTKLRAEDNNMRVLFGYEVNILVGNKIALPAEFLRQLDYVIAGIHTAIDQDRDTMTARLLAAIENEYVDIIAHPLNRLLNEREASDINWVKVFDAAKANDKILEINCQPNRLDLSYDLVLEAKNKGIKLIVNSDSHEPTQLLYMRYGIDVARRGWCEKRDVLNTLGLNEFLDAMKIK